MTLQKKTQNFMKCIRETHILYKVLVEAIIVPEFNSLAIYLAVLYKRNNIHDQGVLMSQLFFYCACS